jgi:hypothetical protein
MESVEKSGQLAGCSDRWNRYNVALMYSGRAHDPVPAHVRVANEASMEKWMCWGAMGVSGVLLLLFILDVVMKIPFGGLSTVVDIVSAVACAVVLYLAWDAFSDLR